MLFRSILNFKKFKIIVKIKSSVKQKKLKNIVNVKFGLRQKILLLRQHDHHKKVKNIFQENKIPTWLRCNWPLIFVNDELIAICGVAAVKQQTATSEDFDFSSKCIFSWGLNGHLERTDKIF